MRFKLKRTRRWNEKEIEHFKRWVMRNHFLSTYYVDGKEIWPYPAVEYSREKLRNLVPQIIVRKF